MPTPLPGARCARICTLDRGWYVHEVRGVNYLSWVTAASRPHSAIFPLEQAASWVPLLEEMSGLELIFEEV